MYKQNQKTNNKIEIIKNNQILELKSTKTKKKPNNFTRLIQKHIQAGRKISKVNIGQLKLPSLRSRNKRK